MLSSLLGGALCLLLCVRVRPAGGEVTHRHVFTSHANLLKLYYMEAESLSNADMFLREELLHHHDQASMDAAHNLTAVQNLVEEAKETHRQVGSKVKEYLSHPINVFHLVQRLHSGWKEAIALIRSGKACREWHMPHVISRLTNIEANLPTADDMALVAYNLLIIQHTQGIRTADFLKGLVGRYVSLSPVTPQEQFRIAKQAVEEDDYYYAALWLKHLSASPRLKDMRREEDGFNVTNVFGMLASAFYRINRVPDALKAVEQLLKTDPGNRVALSNKAFFEQRLSRKGSDKAEYAVRHGKDDEFRKAYETLCRGTGVKPSRHKCRLQPTWPASPISFLKTEVLSRKPPIIAFHDIISRADADLVANISDEEFGSIAIDSEHGFKTPDFTVVLSSVVPKGPKGKVRQANKHFQDVVDKVNNQLKSLHLATGPYIAGESEVRNFGHQGFYLKPAPHFKIHSLGAHTGTAIVFLNDVEMGGEIVFPFTNARLQPKVGTVVYYYPSMGRYHALCPVAYGTEWVLLRSYFEKKAREMCRPHEYPQPKRDRRH